MPYEQNLALISKQDSHIIIKSVALFCVFRLLCKIMAAAICSTVVLEETTCIEE